MSGIIKTLVALVVSILIVAGFTYLVDFELMEFVQARFYNPSILNSYSKENAIDADIAENHLFDLQKRFAAALENPSVRSSFLYNQSPEDIFERSRVFGILMETTSGLQSVQFVDINGLRIHYSTSSRDIMSQNIYSTAYRNYNEDPLSLPYDAVSAAPDSDAKFIMDEQTDRIIFSFPFNDSMDVYRGTALFTISVRALAEKLVAEGRLKVNEDVSITGNPPGILLGSPGSSKKDILKNISGFWNIQISNNALQDRSLLAASSFSRVTIDTGDSGVKFSLISLRTRHGLFFGRLINDYMFSISEPMKLILKLSVFLTIFLTLFFLINLKHNAVTVVQNRIKRLRESLFDQLINKSIQERTKWILELEQRREEIRSDLKHNLKPGKRLEKDIDSIIDKSWDELLALLKTGSDQSLPQNVPQGDAPQDDAPQGDAPQGDAPATPKKPAIAEDAEALEEIGEAEEIETLEEIEEAEALEEIGEAEEIETLEEIEEAETLEEIGEAEEIETLEEIEEAEALEEIEEAEEIEELEELEELEEIEAYDDTDAASKAEIIESRPVGIKPAGLLKLAESKGYEQKKKGLLARAESKEHGSALSGKGLLALASKFKAEPKKHSKGLSEITGEIEFGVETEIDEQEDWSADIDVVSPFSSMFSSLENNR